MKIILSNHIDITGSPEPVLKKIRSTFTLENPVWVANEKMGRWNGRTDHWLTFFKNHPGGISIPRGAMGLLQSFCNEKGIQYEIEDRRRTLPETIFQFVGKLKPYQQKALQDATGKDFAVLEAPTGSGKTVTALAAIAARKQPTLIIVHGKELLNQWKARIETFLGIPPEDIGQIGDGKMKIGDKVTVGIVNSVYKIAGDIRDRIGHLVIDECHRCPSRTFTEAVTAFDCKYMLGLSATPYRNDRLTPLIGWHLGQKVEIKPEN
ncbi:MAG: DEAD/DEAH box helicase family protein, partial [Deltaproteobacteria bacterium]